MITIIIITDIIHFDNIIIITIITISTMYYYYSSSKHKGPLEIVISIGMGRMQKEVLIYLLIKRRIKRYSYKVDQIVISQLANENVSTK